MTHENKELDKSVKQFQLAMSGVKSLTGSSSMGQSEIAIAKALMVDMRLRSIEEALYSLHLAVNELDSIKSQLGHIRDHIQDLS